MRIKVKVKDIIISYQAEQVRDTLGDVWMVHCLIFSVLMPTLYLDCGWSTYGLLPSQHPHSNLEALDSQQTCFSYCNFLRLLKLSILNRFLHQESFSNPQAFQNFIQKSKNCYFACLHLCLPYFMQIIQYQQKWLLLYFPFLEIQFLLLYDFVGFHNVLVKIPVLPVLTVNENDKGEML